MAILKRIFIIHTTADKPDAETNATFRLIAQTRGGDFNEPFPTYDFDERQRGRTEEYEFDVLSGRPPEDQVDSDHTQIHIQMATTTDGWLPKSIWALGETVSGEFIILGAHPEWGNGFFDRGDNPAGPHTHKIN